MPSRLQENFNIFIIITELSQKWAVLLITDNISPDCRNSFFSVAIYIQALVVTYNRPSVMKDPKILALIFALILLSIGK